MVGVESLSWGVCAGACGEVGAGWGGRAGGWPGGGPVVARVGGSVRSRAVSDVGVLGGVGGVLVDRVGGVVSGRWGGVLSVEGVRGVAGAAAAWAREADGVWLGGPGPVAGPEWGSRYCWLVLAGLSRRWFPGGRFPEMRSALRWPGVGAWVDVVVSLVGAGAGAFVYVRVGRPGRMGHAFAIYNTGDEGLVLIDPDQGAEAGYTGVVGVEGVTGWLTGERGSGGGGVPLIDAGVFFQAPHGRVAAGPGRGGRAGGLSRGRLPVLCPMLPILTPGPLSRVI